MPMIKISVSTGGEQKVTVEWEADNGVQKEFLWKFLDDYLKSPNVIMLSEKGYDK